jgi:hypothetical protein
VATGPDDAVVLGVAVATVLATAPAVGERTAGAAEVVDAFDRLLGWLDPLWQTGYAGASVALAGTAWLRVARV